MTPYKSALLNQINVSVIKELCPSVVVDPMYGAATDLLADVLSAAGCVVHQMHQGPVRDFGGIHPQPAAESTSASRSVAAPYIGSTTTLGRSSLITDTLI